MNFLPISARLDFMQSPESTESKVVTVAGTLPKEEQQQLPEETVQLLLQYQERFTRSVNHGLNRIERIELLMKRKSAQKWKPEKMTKMIRRTQAAQKHIEENATMLEQVNFRLQQHMPGV